MMIEKTKELVEAKYTVANGYKHDAKVHLQYSVTLSNSKQLLMVKKVHLEYKCK